MVHVINPTTLRIDENEDDCLLEFLALRDGWTASAPRSHLPRPEAVLEFQFDVQSHYETQNNFDADTYGRDLSLLDDVWGEFSFLEEERLQSIVDAFPLVSDVLRRMTSLERLVWSADLALIHGIDDAIASLTKLRLFEVNLNGYWPLDARCLHRLPHISTVILNVGWLYVRPFDAYEESLPDSMEELEEGEGPGRPLDEEQACPLHARWLASCTQLSTLQTTEYTLFDPAVVAVPGVLSTLANADVKLLPLPPNSELVEDPVNVRGKEEHGIAAAALRPELLKQLSNENGALSVEMVHRVAHLDVMQPWKHLLSEDGIARSIASTFRHVQD